MVTYLTWSLPTILLALALGLLLGWMTWGRGRRKLAADADGSRRALARSQREIADRDSTIAILRDELADEAGELARLRRIVASDKMLSTPLARLPEGLARGASAAPAGDGPAPAATERIPQDVPAPPAPPDQAPMASSSRRPRRR